MADQTHNTSKMDRTPLELSRTGVTGVVSQERIMQLKDKIGFVLTPLSHLPKVNVEEHVFKCDRLNYVVKNKIMELE